MRDHLTTSERISYIVSDGYEFVLTHYRVPVEGNSNGLMRACHHSKYKKRYGNKVDYNHFGGMTVVWVKNSKYGYVRKSIYEFSDTERFDFKRGSHIAVARAFADFSEHRAELERYAALQQKTHEAEVVSVTPVKDLVVVNPTPVETKPVLKLLDKVNETEAFFYVILAKGKNKKNDRYVANTDQSLENYDGKLHTSVFYDTFIEEYSDHSLKNYTDDPEKAAKFKSVEEAMRKVWIDNEVVKKMLVKNSIYYTLKDE